MDLVPVRNLGPQREVAFGRNTKRGQEGSVRRPAAGAAGHGGDQRACIDYEALQLAARRLRRTSCTALTPSSIASSSESVLRSCTRRRVSRPRVIFAIDSSSSRSLISDAAMPEWWRRVERPLHLAVGRPNRRANSLELGRS